MSTIRRRAARSLLVGRLYSGSIDRAVPSPRHVLGQRPLVRSAAAYASECAVLTGSASNRVSYATEGGAGPGHAKRDENLPPISGKFPVEANDIYFVHAVCFISIYIT